MRTVLIIINVAREKRHVVGYTAERKTNEQRRRWQHQPQQQSV